MSAYRERSSVRYEEFEISIKLLTIVFKQKIDNFPFPRSMVDDKVEMNNDSDNYTTANTTDPKNVQELTQYVSKCS